jgi:hypothetical protein
MTSGPPPTFEFAPAGRGRGAAVKPGCCVEAGGVRIFCGDIVANETDHDSGVNTLGLRGLERRASARPIHNSITQVQP